MPTLRGRSKMSIVLGLRSRLNVALFDLGFQSSQWEVITEEEFKKEAIVLTKTGGTQFGLYYQEFETLLRVIVPVSHYRVVAYFRKIGE
jgi:hypothetical protein